MMLRACLKSPNSRRKEEGVQVYVDDAATKKLGFSDRL
jgi:hypothetical protein